MYQNWIRHQHCIFITNTFFFVYLSTFKATEICFDGVFFHWKKEYCARQTNRKDRFNTRGKGSENKNKRRMRRKKKKRRNHWFERTLTCVHHHIIHSLFRSITFTQTLLNSESKHFVVFGVEQQFNAFTKTPDKYAQAIKCQICVCVYHVCIYLRYYLYNMLHIEAIGLLQRISFSY